MASEAAEKLLGFHLPPEPSQDETEETSAVIGYVRLQKGSTLHLYPINIDIICSLCARKMPTYSNICLSALVNHRQKIYHRMTTWFVCHRSRYTPRLQNKFQTKGYTQFQSMSYKLYQKISVISKHNLTKRM